MGLGLGLGLGLELGLELELGIGAGFRRFEIRRNAKEPSYLPGQNDVLSLPELVAATARIFTVDRVDTTTLSARLSSII